MAKRYICKACDTLYVFTHKCDKVCSLCTATQTCTKHQKRYCATCSRWFLSEKCFQYHLTLKGKARLLCQWRQVCRNCNYVVTLDNKHECFKKCCIYSYKNQPSGHFCYVAALKPSKLSDRFLYVFFDTECTQDLERRDGSFMHLPILMCSANVF